MGEALVPSWHKHDEVPPLPPDEDELLFAMRQIAQRCLYGVDKNPLAADLAKLSLWLATLAKDHPFTFIDHALRSGDSLVGFNVRQISYFHWSPEGQTNLFGERFEQKLELVLRNRAVILDAPDSVPYETKRQQLAKADEYLTDARMAGDALAAAFFAGAKPKEREQKRASVGAVIKRSFDKIVDLDADTTLRAEIATLHANGVVPFHWEIEFPEVFRKGGFDVIVGNPPFAGRNTIIQSTADGYLDWLKQLHEPSEANADLAAHFYRRAFCLLRDGGSFGLIATNSIAQGESRFTGLRWICTHGGTIFRARKRLPWPGQAAVVVSVVHVFKGTISGPYWLDGKQVDAITAYLFHAGGHEDPAKLHANDGMASEGTKIYGAGFTFDDTDREGTASPVREMHRVIEKDPRNADRIFPYLGGEEVNERPDHSHHRYVIDFEDFPLRRENMGESWSLADDRRKETWLRSGIVPLDYPNPVAMDWPDLVEIVENRVRPSRQPDMSAPWWRFERRRAKLYAALKQLNETLVVNCGATPHLAVTFVRTGQVFAHSLVVFPTVSRAFFAVIQSRSHEVWARREASSMKDDLRYTHSACLHNFPFPSRFEHCTTLCEVGDEYFSFRAALMLQNGEGLTKTYNRFHDPEDDSSGTVKLRELHAKMDWVVLGSYGWTDLTPRCDFKPAFEDEEDEDENGRPRRKKYRYRWPDEFRDEVLARLLELNRQRAIEEGQLPTAPPVFAGPVDPEPKTKRRKTLKQPSGAPDQSLLSLEEGEA